MMGCSLQNPVQLWHNPNSSHIQDPVKYLLCRILFRTICNPSIFKTLAYSELKAYWYTVKHLPWNILFKTLCNPDIFRALVYSELWYILKLKHIQSYSEYLRCSTLLRALCNYSIFRRSICSNLSLIQNANVSAGPCQLLL